MKGISVVIPALNEEKTIGRVIRGASKHADEIIVVDDGSTDSTAKISKSLGAKVVSHAKKLGYTKSLNDGFAASSGSVIVTLDADNEQDPADIPRLTKPIAGGKADIVIGKRSVVKRFGQKIFAAYTKRRIGVSDPWSGFKAYSRRVYKSVGYFDSKNLVGMEILFKAHRKGFRIIEVSTINKQRSDSSRFGGAVIGNVKALKALAKLILMRL
jgi:glycosyltransferase involved in cell wall biosynthesis